MKGRNSVRSEEKVERTNLSTKGDKTIPISVKTLIVLEAVLVFFGFASGLQFIRDPTGGTHDMDTSILEGTPVGDFLLVGLFFVICYGILPVLIIYGLWKLPRWSWTDALNRWTGQNWAWTAAAATGVILIAWIIVEVYYIGSPEGFPRFLQVTFALLGAVILAIAFLPRTRAYAKLAVPPRAPEESQVVEPRPKTVSTPPQDVRIDVKPYETGRRD